ncbi:MAG: hypothetical protein Q7Q71_08740 [Verrucomicrobiota bacterium JB023]|nr:hypothetical protein [Verrucomicrobiota bacterium JB023]
MKKYTTIIGVVLTGALTVTASARGDEKDHYRKDHRTTVSKHKVVAKKPGKKVAQVRKVTSNKPLARLPRHHQRVSHRGVSYYIANGVWYRALPSGYIVVKRPW